MSSRADLLVLAIRLRIGATDRGLSREVAWRQTIAVLRAYLGDAGSERERSDAAFAG